MNQGKVADMELERQILTTCLIAACCWLVGAEDCGAWAQDKSELLAKVEKTFGDPPGMKRLDPVSRAWVDLKKKLVVVDGYVALQMGQLEMFACPSGTKEHESVVGLFTKAYHLHAGLLAIGAKQGRPVKWEPEYQPATGSEIQILALWTDDKGVRQSVDARTWVQDLGTKETLSTNWVFAGSLFYKDPDTGEQRYQAEGGDLVCVSNFATATLDVPLQSSQVNSGLLYVANTLKIPPEGTPVRLVFQVAAPKPADSKDSKKVTADATQNGQPKANPAKPQDSAAPKKNGIPTKNGPTPAIRAPKNPSPSKSPEPPTKTPTKPVRKQA